ncbi:hypothetical protein F2Q68_00046289 [Brassica cretica]|uniref:Uncharacterized protein n=1 Tax=Brassica cretica TaxID=69181 RepID=A0A8S9LTW0_BRACR|nr:hypothetical protein F2Q68_00046289 [Brassica cretica]
MASEVNRRKHFKEAEYTCNCGSDTLLCVRYSGKVYIRVLQGFEYRRLFSHGAMMTSGSIQHVYVGLRLCLLALCLMVVFTSGSSKMMTERTSHQRYQAERCD